MKAIERLRRWSRPFAVVVLALLCTEDESEASSAVQPRLSIDRQSNTAQLRWFGDSEQKFDILHSDSLKGPWSLANEEPVGSEDSAFVFSVSIDESVGFFRVEPAFEDPGPSIATRGLPFWPPFRTDTIYYGVDRLELPAIAAPGDKGRIKLLYFNDTRREYERKVDIRVDAVEVDSGVRIPLVDRRFRLFMHENERDDPTQYDLTIERPKTPYRSKFYRFRLPQDFPGGVYQLETFTTDFKTGQDIGVNYLTHHEIYVPDSEILLALESKNAPLDKALRPGKKVSLKLRMFNDGNVSVDESVGVRVHFAPMNANGEVVEDRSRWTLVYDETRRLKVKRGAAKGLKLKAALPKDFTTFPFLAVVEVFLPDQIEFPVNADSTLGLVYPTVFTAK